MRWCLKSPASPLFTQPFIQAQVKKKTSKLRVTGFCAGNSPVTDEFPAQIASNAGNISIWWRHHATGNRWFAACEKRGNDKTVKIGLAPLTLERLFLTWINWISAWISNHTPSKVWDKDTFPFPGIEVNHNIGRVFVLLGARSALVSITRWWQKM